jgi:hypothetical protein
LNEIHEVAKSRGEKLVESTDVAGYENCPKLRQVQDFTKYRKKKSLEGETA